MERYRRYQGHGRDQNEKTEFKVVFIRQTIICTVLVLLFFAISVLKTDTAKSISKKVKDTVSYTVDYKQAVSNMTASIKNIMEGNKDDTYEKKDIKTD